LSQNDKFHILIFTISGLYYIMDLEDCKPKFKIAMRGLRRIEEL